LKQDILTQLLSEKAAKTSIQNAEQEKINKVCHVYLCKNNFNLIYVTTPFIDAGYEFALKERLRTPSISQCRTQDQFSISSKKI